MQSNCTGRLLSVVLVFLHTIMSLMPVHAQQLDSSPPVIESRVVEQGFRGEKQVFTATVTDDRQVASVVLHYRHSSEELFQNREMQRLGSTDIFSVTLPSDTDSRVIQYYLEAKDEAQNRTLQGFAFDPLERQLVSRAAEITQAPAIEDSATSGMSTGRKILYGVLGLAVVGALASAGDSGGDSSPPGGDDVNVTIVVEPLP